MKYKNFNISPNVNSYYLYNSDICVWKHNVLYKNDLIIYEGEINQVYFFKSSCLLVINSFESSLFINKERNLTKHLGDINSFNCFVTEFQFIFSKWKENYTLLTLNKFDVITNKIVWNTESYFTPSLIIKNNIYGYKDDSILKIEDETISPIWQFPLSKFGTYTLAGDEKEYKVLKFIGEYEGKLLVQLTNSLLLILDIQSGEQIKVIDLKEYVSFPSGVVFDDYIPMHLADDKLKWLSNQILLHIDLESFEVKIIKEYFKDERANQFRFMSNTYYKDHIYFVADYGWQYVTASNVGVMDANTGKVLWYQQLEKTGGISEAPQVTDDKLYVRTNNNVLHIFQKEDQTIN